MVKRFQRILIVKLIPIQSYRGFLFAVLAWVLDNDIVIGEVEPQVELVGSLSDKYFWEKYKPHYPLSYSLNDLFFDKNSFGIELPAKVGMP